MAKSVVLELFRAQPKSYFGEHLATEASNNVWKNNDCMGDFRQQAAKFVFNVSNLLFSQVPTLQTKTSSGSVENVQPRFESPRRDPFLTLLHLWVSTHTLETTGLGKIN